jgi:DNA (cytosine-5)-methyltransferase 1
MALGFRAAGARCVGAVEWNGPASETFKATFREEDPVVFGGPDGGDVNQLPVHKLLESLKEQPDIVVGGPPCQGFSRIGRAKHASLLDEDARVLHGGVRDPGRNQLYKYFLGMVRAARPLAFVMENVPGMREGLGSDFAHRIAREANVAGYNVRYFLLNAANYGVPQHRWRLFFVGLRSDLGVQAIPQPPIRTHSAQSVLEGAALPEDPWMVAGSDIPWAPRPRPAVTVKDALWDLPKLKGHLSESDDPLDVRLPLRREPSDYARMLRSWPGLETPQTISGNWYRRTPRDFRTFANMAQGDRYPEAVEVANRLFREALGKLSDPPEVGSAAWEELRAAHVPPYRNDAFHDKWRKLRMDEPSWTVTAHLSKDAYSHIHYDSRQARTITIREAARLQSFPDAVDFQGNYGEQFRQIGNAVPPVLARALAMRLFVQLHELGAIRDTRATS